MSQQSLPGARRLLVMVPMVGRDPEEPHRAATPLELFFDLVFVAAVAFASERLHYGLAEGHVGEAVLSFAMVFFAIWWAWMNFTWFASAYDTDDVIYRVFVFVTMTGALILAAGVPLAFDERRYGVVVLGYVVMRVALVTQWIRAARHDADRHTTASRYAIGVSALQVGWIAAAIWFQDWWLWAWAVLGPLELLVPVWAEAASLTTWNAEHIAERYGLFMIIVLGESVLAATIAIQSAATEVGLTAELVPIVVGGLLIVFSLWWLYFDRPRDHLLVMTKAVFVWGYAHLVVFASAAAVGSALALAIDDASNHMELGSAGVGLATAVPVSLFLFSIWGLHVHAADPPLRKYGAPVAAILSLAAAFTGQAVLLVGLILVGYVALKAGARIREGREIAT
ncbi:MAG TPA: low temperature requirement protein A [Actinomycetota bacterium]|nr:low temperature requirement protein A [Actinomycetota bacterium]